MFNLFKKKTKGTKVTFKLSGMHCTSCSLSVDGELEDTPGVLSSDTSYPRSETTIQYDPTKVDEKSLIKVIESLEYKVV